MTQQPSIGRVVHYVSNHSGPEKGLTTHVAAVITAVNPNGSVNLTLIPDKLNYTIPVPSCINDEENMFPGTWHWPERI